MIAALFFTTVSTLTPQEAQALPLAELAQRVLGAAGAVVIDVERPRWPTCVGLCPRPVPHPIGPPPLTMLTFYTRASVSGEAGWLGLCRATAIDVSFDKAGAVTDVKQRETVGWLGNITRSKSDDDPTDVVAISTQYDDFNTRCRQLPTTKKFIPALNRRDVARAFVAVSLVHESMIRDGPIHVTCAIHPLFRQPCGTSADLLALAKNVVADKIISVKQVDTSIGGPVTGKSPKKECYNISLSQAYHASDHINICMQVSFYSLIVTRAEFSRSLVVY